MIIRDKVTKKAICQVCEAHLTNNLNPKYEAVTVKQHLADLRMLHGHA